MKPNTSHAIAPAVLARLRRRLTVPAVFGVALLGSLGVLGAERADAHLCYKGGYCPSVFQTTTFFRMSTMHAGGCMTWRTSTAADSQQPWTEGTVEVRSCHTQAGEPQGNVIGLFSAGQQNQTIEFSVFGHWTPVW